VSRFEVQDTPLSGLKLLRRRSLGDERGFLARLFCAGDLAACGWAQPIAQINHTCTRAPGTLRGMHFQHPPHAEMKLVHCVRGAVWDVAVDLRAGSDTFLCWYAAELSAENLQALLIPPGFAHGFQSLREDSELLYCHSAAYRAEAEGGLDPRDPRLAIPWPLPVQAISVRDAGQRPLDAAFAGLRL
jgi:dTDP-4-dehydrorhamnose 3,5-epimerase